MIRVIFHDESRGSSHRPMMSRPISVTPEDEKEFRSAMEFYKKESGRQFPTWSEVLEVLRSIGYAKRVWKPVEAWAALPTKSPTETPEGDAGPEMAGWYTRVETPV